MPLPFDIMGGAPPAMPGGGGVRYDLMDEEQLRELAKTDYKAAEALGQRGGQASSPTGKGIYSILRGLESGGQSAFSGAAALPGKAGSTVDEMVSKLGDFAKQGADETGKLTQHSLGQILAQFSKMMPAGGGGGALPEGGAPGQEAPSPFGKDVRTMLGGLNSMVGAGDEALRGGASAVGDAASGIGRSASGSIDQIVNYIAGQGPGAFGPKVAPNPTQGDVMPALMASMGGGPTPAGPPAPAAGGPGAGPMAGAVPPVNRPPQINPFIAAPPTEISPVSAMPKMDGPGLFAPGGRFGADTGPSIDETTIAALGQPGPTPLMPPTPGTLDTGGATPTAPQGADAGGFGGATSQAGMMSLLNFGLKLMQAGDVKPGADQGPTFGGAVGEAGSGALSDFMKTAATKKASDKDERRFKEKMKIEREKIDAGRASKELQAQQRQTANDIAGVRARIAEKGLEQNKASTVLDITKARDKAVNDNRSNFALNEEEKAAEDKRIRSGYDQILEDFGGKAKSPRAARPGGGGRGSRATMPDGRGIHVEGNKWVYDDDGAPVDGR